MLYIIITTALIIIIGYTAEWVDYHTEAHWFSMIRVTAIVLATIVVLSCMFLIILSVIIHYNMAYVDLLLYMFFINSSWLSMLEDGPEQIKFILGVK